MKFYHLSDKPFTTFRTRKLVNDMKPNGLWLAPKGVWKTYIQEELDNETPKYEYEFNINMTKIITLKTYNDIFEFNENYAILEGNYKVINWNLVKKNYDGIYIKESQIKKARKDFIWYSSFDVESICVWDKNSIESFILS